MGDLAFLEGFRSNALAGGDGVLKLSAGKGLNAGRGARGVAVGTLSKAKSRAFTTGFAAGFAVSMVEVDIMDGFDGVVPTVEGWEGWDETVASVVEVKLYIWLQQRI